MDVGEGVFLIIQFHEFTHSAHQFENVFIFQDIVNERLLEKLKLYC